MSNTFLLCMRCNVFIQIDTDCGGVDGVTVWGFVRRHSHMLNMLRIKYLKEVSCHLGSSLLDGYEKEKI